jgi:hypothetical protein
MAREFIDIGVPSQMTVQKNAHQLCITRKWFEKTWLVFISFVIAWDVFLLWWYIRVFSATQLDLLAILFPLLHVLLGASSTYLLLTVFLNTTTINVTSKMISIRHGPLPFWGNKRVASTTLLQLYCKRDEFWHHLQKITTFSVRAITNDRKNITLLSGLQKAEQALFIEQEVEEFLGIEDRPVKGQIK